jgi:hypothetical protein
MKYVVATTLALLSASPAFAAGGAKVGGLIGSVVTPITTAVSALNVNALNNVSILNGNSVAVNAPISVGRNSILSGILGGGSEGRGGRGWDGRHGWGGGEHGCGCN